METGILSKPIIIVTALSLFCMASTPASASVGTVVNMGVSGRTYRIAEPDAMAEIKSAAARSDWKKFMDREKVTQRVKHYRPADLRQLPPAKADRSFLVDMTYTLDMDIPDGKGGVLYPKGYSFNPLDYIALPITLVVLDGNSLDQLNWFIHSAYADDLRTRLIVTDGNYYDLIEKFDRPVFYLPAEMTSRLKLSAVPSVVQQQGKKMLVREFRVPVKHQEKGRD